LARKFEIFWRWEKNSVRKWKISLKNFYLAKLLNLTNFRHLYHFLTHKSYSVYWTSYCVEYDGKTKKISWKRDIEISEGFCWHPKCENQVLKEICASHLDVTEIP
jgi:hypothetical protein